ncbi:zinc dependent phospholipase C family protein [Desulfitobacterium sp. PCE1]|uniref:zinc dependent phospholipase C family protein n=1 Tax=Desulfitobacterium sp. PCE1 TaxID=146907 RepID=UPI00037FD81B|nr:zinc dependent phospholipase C family protein [Desulfitobacterium sp. PCE1]
MKILTHITISMILFKHFKGHMKLNRACFMYGNIKPDLSYKLVKKAHIMENHFAYVCNSTNELIEKDVITLLIQMYWKRTLSMRSPRLYGSVNPWPTTYPNLLNLYCRRKWPLTR